MSVRQKIESALDLVTESSKKVISVNIDAELLERIDWVMDGFSKLGKGYTRNAIIEMAIDAYVEEAQEIIDERLPEPEIEADYDTAIFPARNAGFNTAFLEQNQWYAVRINADRIPNIKYVACYRAAPISGITHYAKVKSIKQYADTNKKIIYFDGSPISLSSKKVSLGDTNANAMRSPRYTTLKKLLDAKVLSDLF